MRRRDTGAEHGMEERGEGAGQSYSRGCDIAGKDCSDARTKIAAHNPAFRLLPAESGAAEGVRALRALLRLVRGFFKAHNKGGASWRERHRQGNRGLHTALRLREAVLCH